MLDSKNIEETLGKLNNWYLFITAIEEQLGIMSAAVYNKNLAQEEVIARLTTCSHFILNMIHNRKDMPNEDSE